MDTISPETKEDRLEYVGTRRMFWVTFSIILTTAITLIAGGIYVMIHFLAKIW